VIGSEAKTKLFSGRFALGEYIRVDGVSFQVIGVLEPKMQEGDDNINRIIYVPFTTMGDVKNTQYLDGIWMDYEGLDYEKAEQMGPRDDGAGARFPRRRPSRRVLYSTRSSGSRSSASS
jgi:hypothetical protein